MLPDLRLGRLDCGEDATSEAAEAWRELQALYFNPPATPAAAVGKAAAKAKAKPQARRAKQVQRKQAYRYLRTLDYLLLLALGCGLRAFLPDEPTPAGWAHQPARVLNMDQGSPAFAITWYLEYHLGARFLCVRNAFHREWNDIRGAIRDAGLWWVILLTSLTFNLCYGPCNGSAWFEKLKGGATELLAKQKVADPLFQAFYPSICNDARQTVLGTEAHQAEVLQAMATSEAFALKGHRVTLKRWFSWMDAADFHDRTWHQRLLVITSIGMELGVCKSLQDIPFFGGLSAFCKRGSPEEEREKQEGEAVEGLARAAKEVGAASSSAEVKAPEGAGLMQTEDNSLKKLRQSCSNTLYVAGAVLGREGLQTMARVVRVFAAPFLRQPQCQRALTQEARGHSGLVHSAGQGGMVGDFGSVHQPASRPQRLGLLGDGRQLPRCLFYSHCAPP